MMGQSNITRVNRTKNLFLLGVLAILPAIAISTPSLLAANQKDGNTKKKPQPSTSRAELISNMKSAVIQISYKSDLPVPNPAKLSRDGLAGTGFLVSRDGYALTAAHVIAETKRQLQLNGARDVRFFAGISLDSASIPGRIILLGSFSQISCTVVEMDEAHDTAVLRLDQNPFSPLYRPTKGLGVSTMPVRVQTAGLQAELPVEGAELLVSGYPLSFPTLVTQRGTVASLSFTLVEIEKPGALSWFKFPAVADQILADIVVNPGNSGGPFYQSDTGKVIGICHGNLLSPVHLENGAIVQTQDGGMTHTLEQNSGLAVVLPIKYAIELLDKNKSLTNIDFPAGCPGSAFWYLGLGVLHS